MERWANHIVGSLLETWQEATLTDYGHLLMAVIIAGWFIGRYFPR